MPAKKQIYIISSLFILGALALVLFAVVPLINDIQASSDNLISKKNSIEAARIQFEKANNFQQKYEDYKPNLEKIDNLFVESGNPVNFIEFLEKTAGDVGVQLQISPPTFSKEGNLNSANFQLSFSGNFTQIMKLLREMELSPYLAQIQTLNIDYRETKDAKTAVITKKITANMAVKVLAK